MRFSTTSVLLLPSVALASSSPGELNSDAPEDITVRVITITAPTPSIELDINHDSVSTPTPSPTTHFNDLELRQGVGAAGGTVAVSAAVTQMPPVSTYLIHGVNGQQTPYVYTQTFVKVPDQWPAPTAGTIGLGTISGKVGVVKTNTKRSVWQTAEAVVKRAVVERRSTNDAMHTTGREDGRGLWIALGGVLGILGLVGVL